MNKLLEAIETMNTKILNFLYNHTKPEEMVDDIKDSKLREICKEIVKWYGEMGEYWCDNPVRIADNYAWGTKLLAKCNGYKEVA